MMFGQPVLCVEALKHMDKIVKLEETDPEMLTHICYEALDLKQHEEWRVRCAFMAQSGVIFEHLSAGDGSEIQELWNQFLQVMDLAIWDQVAEARTRFAENLPSLIHWIESLENPNLSPAIIFDKLMEQHAVPAGEPAPGTVEADGRKNSYLYTISVLTCIKHVLTMSPSPKVLEDQGLVNSLVDLVVKDCKSKVPNIRLVAVQTVSAYATHIKSGAGGVTMSLRSVQLYSEAAILKAWQGSVSLTGLLRVCFVRLSIHDPPQGRGCGPPAPAPLH